MLSSSNLKKLVLELDFDYNVEIKLAKSLGVRFSTGLFVGGVYETYDRLLPSRRIEIGKTVRFSVKKS